MPACRRQRHPYSVGAPLAPVAAPDDSRRSRLLVKNERDPVFVQGPRSWQSAFSPAGRRRARIAVVRTGWNGSRQIECSSNAKRRLLHRERASLIARVVDEQEIFRKRSVAGHNLRSRTLLARAASSRPQCCTVRRRSRELTFGQDRGQDRNVRMALHGAAGQASASGLRGEPIVHLSARFVSLAIRITFFAAALGAAAAGVRDDPRRNAGQPARNEHK
jgi:hypothetical protein